MNYRGNRMRNLHKNTVRWLRNIFLLYLTCTGIAAEGTKYPWDWKTQGDLHEVMIRSVLEKDPERYALVRSVLQAEPDRANPMVFSIKWNIDHAWNIKTTHKAITLLSAAIKARDFDMVELLLAYDIALCDRPNDDTCAIDVARREGLDELADVLMREWIERSKAVRGKRQE